MSKDNKDNKEGSDSDASSGRSSMPGRKQTIPTTVPYIKQASLQHELKADVANSGFTIVLPPMENWVGGLFFTVEGRTSYVSRVDFPPSPGKEIVDQVTSDRIRAEFVVGDKVKVLPIQHNGAEQFPGTPSEEITII